jgi:hypothetical protein
MLDGRLLLGLMDLLVRLDDGMPVLLLHISPACPWVDGGRHPGPGHGVRGCEGRPELLLHGWAAENLFPLDLGYGGCLLDGNRGRRGGYVRLGRPRGLRSLLLLGDSLLLGGTRGGYGLRDLWPCAGLGLLAGGGYRTGN